MEKETKYTQTKEEQDYDYYDSIYANLQYIKNIEAILYELVDIYNSIGDLSPEQEERFRLALERRDVLSDIIKCDIYFGGS